MYKKTITYEDLNGVERTEHFFFNLTETELTKWNMGEQGGLAEILQAMMDSKDQAKIAAMIDEIVIRSYGEKSEDGRRFIKSRELSEAFMQTPAYDIFFQQLCSSEDEVSNFIHAVLPTKLVNGIDGNEKKTL